jgi:hypothetical protein
VAKISFLLQVSKNFSNPRDLPTNLVVALLAVLLRNPNPVSAVVEDAVAVVVFKAENVKCMTLFAHPAVKAQPFLFNPVETNQFIAAIVSNPEDHTKINQKPPLQVAFILHSHFFLGFFTEKPKLPTASFNVQYWP